MSQGSGFVVVLTTTGNEQDAEELAKKTVEAKLAACVQVHPIKSYYTWKGNISVDAEFLLLMKTRDDLFEKLKAFILGNHKYETPEIIQIPVTRGFDGYLRWIEEATNG